MWKLPLEIDGNSHFRAWVRSNFPQLKNMVYLNSAGSTPLPAVTISRMKKEFRRNFEQMYKGLDEEASLADFAKEGSSARRKRKSRS